MYRMLICLCCAMILGCSTTPKPAPISADQAFGLDKGPGPADEDATEVPMPLPEGRYRLRNLELAGRPWVRLIMDDGQYENKRFVCAAQLPEGCASCDCAVIDRKFCFPDRPHPHASRRPGATAPDVLVRECGKQGDPGCLKLAARCKPVRQGDSACPPLIRRCSQNWIGEIEPACRLAFGDMLAEINRQVDEGTRDLETVPLPP